MTDLGSDPPKDLDWGPKCFLSLLREMERMAERETVLPERRQ
ncbi:hypothetical protein [Ancylobacter sp. Lp-2]|nr:hypothetical protein [Ancylobacter sp. Lp-2]